MRGIARPGPSFNRDQLWSLVGIAVIVSCAGLALSFYNLAATLTLGPATQAFSLSIQPMVIVYVNSDTGTDTNTGLLSTRAVRTVRRGLEILQQRSGSKAILQLDGTLPHNLGSNSELDFFPLISQYGSILIQGRRRDSMVGIVNQTQLSDPDGVHGFIRVYSETEIPLVFSMIQNLKTGRFYVIENMTTTTIDIVGGDFANQQDPIVFADGDEFELFNLETKIVWSGSLQTRASFSRVCFEALTFEPSDAASQFIMPAYRDDAMLFHGCEIIAKGVASFDFTPNSESGFPIEADPRPTFRGSVHLEGCIVRGDTLTTFETNTQMTLSSVWADGSQIDCSGTCNVIGFYGTNPPGRQLKASTGVFLGQGLKFRGAASTLISNGIAVIHIGTSTLAKMQNIDMDLTTTQFAIYVFLDAHSYGEIRNVRLLGSGVFHGIRFGEACRYRLSNSVSQAFNPISLQSLVSLEILDRMNATGVVPIEVGSNSNLFINAITHIDNIANPGPVMILRDGSKANLNSNTVFWATQVGVPLIETTRASDLIINFNLTNANLANGLVLKCGANAAGIAVTQTDFADPLTQLCKCLVIY